MILRRDQPCPVVREVVVLPVDHDPDHVPAGGAVLDLVDDRPPADEGPTPDVAEHPSETQLERRGAVGVVPGEAARLEVGVEEQQAGLDAAHQQRGMADGDDPASGAGGEDRVPDCSGGTGGHPELVAEVAGEARPGDHNPAARDVDLRVREERQLGDARGKGGEYGARRRPLDRQNAVVVGLVLDRHRQPADQIEEVGEVRLGRGEEEVVVAVTEDHAILEHEPAFVAPQRVLGAAGSAATHVSGQHAGQVALRVRTANAVFVERRAIEDSCAVAHGEVLELRGHLVLLGNQVPGPVSPEPRPVGRLGSGGERGRANHRRPPRKDGRSRRGSRRRDGAERGPRFTWSPAPRRRRPPAPCAPSAGDDEPARRTPHGRPPRRPRC